MDHPGASKQLLSEDHSLQGIWAWGLGTVLTDGDSAAVSFQAWQSLLSWGLFVISAGASLRALPRDEANPHPPLSWV